VKASIERLDRCSRWLSIAAFALMVLVVSQQVLFR
jgi:TRAP-type C4-dicarboxylate transport system permease small subunit